jgi:hypothetical protein
MKSKVDKMTQFGIRPKIAQLGFSLVFHSHPHLLKVFPNLLSLFHLVLIKPFICV